MWFVILFGIGILTFIKKDDIAYNSIYAFSVIQMWFIKYANNTRTNATLTTKPLDYIRMERVSNIDIHESNELTKMTPSGILNKYKGYNMLVYHDDINKICFYPPVSVSTDIKSFEYEVSDVRFISFSIEYDGVNYPIKLNVPNEYNFYIVENVINSRWVFYYFKKYLDIRMLESTQYSIHLVDNNADFLKLTNLDTILFKKETYCVTRNIENRVD